MSFIKIAENTLPRSLYYIEKEIIDQKKELIKKEG
jgi:hypothetical protein